jgi:hypothetical protein
VPGLPPEKKISRYLDCLMTIKYPDVWIASGKRKYLGSYISPDLKISRCQDCQINRKCPGSFLDSQLKMKYPGSWIAS